MDLYLLMKLRAAFEKGNTLLTLPGITPPQAQQLETWLEAEGIDPISFHYREPAQELNTAIGDRARLSAAIEKAENNPAVIAATPTAYCAERLAALERAAATAIERGHWRTVELAVQLLARMGQAENEKPRRSESETARVMRALCSTGRRLHELALQCCGEKQAAKLELDLADTLPAEALWTLSQPTLAVVCAPLNEALARNDMAAALTEFEHLLATGLAAEKRGDSMAGRKIINVARNAQLRVLGNTEHLSEWSGARQRMAAALAGFHYDLRALEQGLAVGR